MALPVSRHEAKEYCLRQLGKPVIQINVDDTQVEDRIDEALNVYWNYHFDGVEKTYYKYELTQTDIDNKYIVMPDNIIGVVHLFPIGQSLTSSKLFDIRYQIALNELYSIANVSMVPYYQTMMHIQLIEQLIVGLQPIRYNKHSNRLFLDMNWDLVESGDIIVVEAYQVVNPNVYPDVWKDVWFLRYLTCLIKLQWGSNLKKYQNLEMPGGIVFNGQQIYNEAMAEKKELEQELIDTWSMPAMLMIG
jgi:hypothetical protein